MTYSGKLPGLIVVVALMMATLAAGQDALAAAKSAGKAQEKAAAEKPYTTQKVRGFSEPHKELLTGRVTIQPDESKCRLVVDTPSKVRCSGNILRTAGESYNVKDGTPWGMGTLECTNGQNIPVVWQLFSDKMGVISGVNSEEKPLYVIYGLPKNEAVALLDSLIASVDPKSSYFAVTGKDPKQYAANDKKDSSRGAAQGVADKAAPAPRQEEKEEGGVGFGTGFFVTDDGVLVTNWHVVEGAKSLVIYFPKERKGVTATIIDRDPVNDLAVLKANVKSTPLPVSVGEVLKGEDIVVLGYPAVSLQGIEQKATFGKINALSGIQGDRRFYQIDAPIQPGNSGGPMLNGSGQVVGIVTATINQDTAYREIGTFAQNVNYALKTDYLNALLRSLDVKYRKGQAGAKKLSATDIVKTSERSVVIVVAE